MRALPLGLICLSMLLSGCGKTRVAPPWKGDDPTYLRVISPVHPFPQAKLVKLVIRNMEFDPKTARIIEHPDTVRVLSAGERATFESALHRVRLIGISPPEPDMAACFVPHHFFRYYSATGRQLGEIAVCFCCGGHMATPGLPYGNGRGGQADQFKMDERKTKAFVQSLGVPTDIMCH